jgi:AcrR family transcriptional regulator
MRVKTEERRRAILQAARGLFLDKGFDGVSMTAVSACLGGSKGTLYGYFESKEELFIAVMLEVSREIADSNHALIRDVSDLRGKLLVAGQQYLRSVLSPNLLAARRLATSEAGRSKVGRDFYEMEARVGWFPLREMLAGQMQTGAMREADPWLATLQFRALLWAGTAEEALFGAIEPPSERDVELAVSRAVDAFLEIYSDEVNSRNIPKKPRKLGI